MQCTHRIEKTCDRGHKLSVICRNSKNRCSKCVKEDAEIERQARRDLSLEQERQARQAAYQKELQEIQDDIDRQRRMIKYRKDETDQEKTLVQQRANLAALKETAHRIVNAPKPTPVMPGSFPGASPLKPPESGKSADAVEGASQEWEHMKRTQCAQSKPLDELIGMIGLEEVKTVFLGIKHRIDLAIRQGISIEKERFSCSMLGNPGTGKWNSSRISATFSAFELGRNTARSIMLTTHSGKTTIARLYAKFLTSIGIIPGSCFKEETGAGLVSAGVNGCKKIIEEILNDGGGVLFIDEAYQLTSGNSQGGAAVLDYLLPAVENLCGKIVFVLAGYNKQMESFFAHNPGLPSRFPVEMKFADYTDDELLQILEMKIHMKYNGRMRCEDGERGLFCRIVARRVGRGRGREGFGNARTIENTLATISQRQATRIQRERRAKKQTNDLLFTKEDLIGPAPSEALSKSKSWKELQGLVGLRTVKEAVSSLMDSVKQNYLRELDEQPPIDYSLNRVFLGNPGTGKTTVAKIYGSILVDLGLLSKGEGEY